MSVDVLSNDDIEILMEALTAWETKDSVGEMIGSLVGALITPKDNEQAQREFKATQEVERTKSEQKVKIRKERSILLQAKLIQLKTSLLTDEINTKIRSAV